MKSLVVKFVVWCAGAAATAMGAAMAHADRIHCLYQPQALPATYLSYDGALKTAFTASGYNDPNCVRSGGRYSDSSGNIDPSTRGRAISPGYHQCRRGHAGVQVVTGKPPYYKKGITLIAPDRRPMVGLRLTFNAFLPGEGTRAYPFESYYGNFPGNPDPNDRWWTTRGVCWTDLMPPVDSSSSGG